ncbi:hypothetical protein DMUE_6351, partial [Dictyocoela muelleri]
SYHIFHEEINFLRNFFRTHFYPVKLFNKIPKRYLAEKYNTCSNTIGPSRNIVYFELPLIGYQTKEMKSEVIKLLNELVRFSRKQRTKNTRLPIIILLNLPSF